jgi:hypothetical protein
VTNKTNILNINYFKKNFKFNYLSSQHKLFFVSSVGILFWWTATFPGLVTYDSILVWGMVKNNSWNSILPLPYLLFVQAIEGITNTTWLVTLLQSLLFSFSLSKLFISVHHNSRIRRGQFVAIFLISIFPPIGIFVNSVWKDSLYVSFYMLSLNYMYKLTLKQNFSIFTVKSIMLIALFVTMASLRLNAFLIVLTFVFVLVILKTEYLKSKLIVVIVSSLLGFIITNVLPIKYATVDETRIQNSMSGFYLDSAISWSSGNPTDSISANSLTQVLSKEQVLSNAKCSQWDSVFEYFNPQPLSDNSRTFLWTWVKQLLNSPESILESRICRAASAITPFPKLVYNSLEMSNSNFSSKGLWNYENIYNLGPNNKFNLTSKLGEFIYKISLTPRLTFLFYWGGFWVWIYLVSIFFARSTFRGASRAFSLVIILSNSFIIGLFNTSLDFRYMMPLVIYIMVVQSKLVLDLVQRADKL